MRALDSMCAAMKQTGLYTLGGNTCVDWELQAYAAGLNMVYDALTELENESYVETANSYGLSQREQQLGIAPVGEIQNRRAAILGLLEITPFDSGRDAVQRAMSAAGMPCELLEKTTEQKIYVNCFMQRADESVLLNGTKIAKLFLPAHLNAELDFRSISWNNIDQADEPFDIKDGKELTWNSIDCYENALIQI